MTQDLEDLKKDELLTRIGNKLTRDQLVVVARLVDQEFSFADATASQPNGSEFGALPPEAL